MTPLSLDPTALGALSPTEAIRVFRRLLLLEAHRHGLPYTAINVPLAVNVPDGGIDATINGTVALSPAEMIANPHTRFQLKTGTTFKPWQDSDLKKELFKSKVASKDHLGVAVRTCLDAGGRYVLVCLGHDVVSPQLDDAERLLREKFAACGYASADVRVLGQGQVASYIERYPAMVLGLSALGVMRFRTHAQWSEDAEMSRTLALGEQQRQFIANVREALHSCDARHIRVCGEAGIGKSRLVLEATRDESLAPLVIYGTAEEFVQDGLINLLERDVRLHAILIADECDNAQRERLATRLAAHSARIRVLSIFQVHDMALGLNLLSVPLLGDGQVTEIIAQYDAPKTVAQRWAALCDGSPRVAHVIGENLRTNPDDILRPPSTSNIWDRYIEGGLPGSDSAVRETRVVLRHLALFHRFGFESPVNQEAQAIAKMVGAVNPSITWQRFKEIIHDLKARRILQGERTLYITPRALHVWLWGEWWDTYGDGFSLEAFLPHLTGKLRDWFIEMWRYAHRSEAARRVVAHLLSPDGPFGDGALLQTEPGSNFFLALTDASPEDALHCLERSVGAWSDEVLQAFTTGRRNVIFALERIVVWRSLFTRGAEVLLALAACENEAWSNNATGVFASLYAPGYGGVAPTEASPEERFPLLQTALSSNEGRRRSIALRAADEALETDHFSRAVGAEYQGLRAPPQLWTPKTWGEWFAAYERVWQLLDQRLDVCNPDDRNELIGVLLKRARGLMRLHPTLTETCIATLSRIVAAGWLATKHVIDVLEDVLRDSGDMEPTQSDSIVAVRDSLIGPSFSGRLQRFISLSRLADQYNEDGTRTDKWDRAVDSLVDEALAEPSLFRAEMAWLSTRDAVNAGTFGYRIGKRDISREFLADIITAFRSANDERSQDLLGGYLQAVNEQDVELWESTLDDLAKEDLFAPSLAELTWRSGLTDRAAMRLVGLVRAGRLRAGSLGVFRLGRLIEQITEAAVDQMTSCVLESAEPEGPFVALELNYNHYERSGEASRPIPIETLKRVVFEERLFAEQSTTVNSLAGHMWVRLATRLVEQDALSGLVLLAYLIDHGKERRSILNRRDREIAGLARRILKADRERGWDVIESRLNHSESTTVYRTLEWLGGHGIDEDRLGHWDLLPLERLWAWIDRHPEERAWLTATAMPKSVSRTGEGAVTRELFVRYGERESVQRNLIARFLGGSWWGNASDRYERLKREAATWREKESDPKVRVWLDKYIATLTQQIEVWRIEEERNDR